jgi:type I restriction enzyme S subunit
MLDNSDNPKKLKVLKLGEVCTYSKGKKPQVLKDSISDVCTIPYINIKAFEKGIISEYTNGEKCNICNDDDLLMVWDGARCGLIGKAIKGAVGSTLMKILPKENIHKEYLYHFISSKFWSLNTKPKGVGIPHIEPTLLWNFELVLPPLPEQQAIVAKIEELLSELENGKEQLLIAQQQLKVYRQSLLKWAFEGKLTNRNVKEDELPKGWQLVKLGEYLEKIEAGKSFKCDERTPQLYEVGVLKVSAVTWQVFNENESKTVIDNDKINENYFVKIDDFLFSRANTLDLIGAAVIVHSVERKLLLSDKTLRFLFKKEILKPYALHYLRSQKGRREIQRLSSGNQESMRNIGQERIKQIEFPLPTLKEQQLIVSELESKLTVCDKIEETISQSLQQSETLKQSILKKAFEGRLV